MFEYPNASFTLTAEEVPNASDIDADDERELVSAEAVLSTSLVADDVASLVEVPSELDSD